MNYQEFLQTIKKEVESRFDSDYTVMIEEIEKNNGLILDGLIILNPRLNISPNIYLNPYYHNYLNGIAIVDIVDEIVDLYYRVVPSKNVNLDLITDFSKAQKRLTLKLVNYDKNLFRLNNIPHYKYLDMAIIFCCIYDIEDSSYSSMLIRNEHLKMWNITADELYKIAIDNTPKLLPVTINNIFDAIKDYISINDFPDENPQMYVITNKMKLHGASAILYTDILKNLSQKFDKDLILLPSSIHEFICIPFTSEIDHINYPALVKEINDEHVSDEEVLSDNAYLYSKDKDTLEYYVA